MPLSLTNQNDAGSFTLQNINNGGSFNASVFVNALYDFTTFTFTNVNITGSNPPLLTQFLASYTGSATWTANSAYFTTESAYRGYQVWTVPQTATYEIEVAGASSGRNTQTSNKFSSGSKMRARFALQQNQKILIVVGQQSGDSNNAGFSGVGGGGGSFVVPSGSNSGSINPLIVAGGGGGNGWYTTGGAQSSSQAFGRTTTYGGSSSFGEGGGVNGLGGKSHVKSTLNAYDGGGGGGFAIGVSGSGMNGAGVQDGGVIANGSYGGGGKGFWRNPSGSIGASFSPQYPPPQATPGGFGGGGGAGPIAGGGGGGYSGGAGTANNPGTSSDGAGGGGSYISSSGTTVATADGNYETLSTFSGSAITNIGYHSGSGYVKITLIS